VGQLSVTTAFLGLKINLSSPKYNIGATIETLGRIKVNENSYDSQVNAAVGLHNHKANILFPQSRFLFHTELETDAPVAQ
jgi:hypothetical protein